MLEEPRDIKIVFSFNLNFVVNMFILSLYGLYGSDIRPHVNLTERLLYPEIYTNCVCFNKIPLYTYNIIVHMYYIPIYFCMCLCVHATSYLNGE